MWKNMGSVRGGGADQEKKSEKKREKEMKKEEKREGRSRNKKE